MSIIDFLCKHMSRVVFYNRCLVVHEDTSGENSVYQFEVFEKKYGEHNSTVVYVGSNEYDATRALENGATKNG